MSEDMLTLVGMMAPVSILAAIIMLTRIRLHRFTRMRLESQIAAQDGLIAAQTEWINGLKTQVVAQGRFANTQNELIDAQNRELTAQHAMIEILRRDVA